MKQPAPNAVTSLRINELSFCYISRSARQRSFEIGRARLTCPTGAITCIAGPSGSGKSTLLKLISGELIAKSGTIEFAGVNLARFPLGSRSTATVHQDYALLRELTVVENVELAITISRGQVSAQSREEVTNILTSLKIDHIADRPVAEISGGEAQRTAIARALVVRPNVLMMDEPTSSLDMLSIDNLVHAISEVKRIAKHCAVLIVSHDRDFCLRIADHLVVLDDGSVVWEGLVSSVLNEPRSRKVYDILGLAFVIDGIVNSDGLVLPAVSKEFKDIVVSREVVGVTLPKGGSLELMIPRNRVSLHARGEPASSLAEGMCFAGVIRRTALNARGQLEYDVQLENGTLWTGIWSANWPGAMNCSQDQAVWIGASGARVLNSKLL